MKYNLSTHIVWYGVAKARFSGPSPIRRNGGLLMATAEFWVADG